MTVEWSTGLLLGRLRGGVSRLAPHSLAGPLYDAICDVCTQVIEVLIEFLLAVLAD